MVRKRTLALVGAGALVAGLGALSTYQRENTETVSYTTVASIGDVELRRYPESVVVETVAPNENAAFRRLFRYIAGANESQTEVSMTAPVEVADEDGSATVSGKAAKIPMTAPVEVSGRGTRVPVPTASGLRSGGRASEGWTDSDASVRMAFYLPPEYDVSSAPRPTDDDVDLVAVPERTLAVKRFTWRPTDDRVREQTTSLLDTLDGADVPIVGDPLFLGYDAPWTLPFLRRNEVAVEVDTR